MQEKNSSIGKQIQITNSPIYCQLKNKTDLYLDMDYESLVMSVSNLSHTIGRYVGADMKKLELYSTILGLGKVDGGKATFDYLNSNISNQLNKINEEDVMLHNLKKIFPDMEQKFSDKDLQELIELFTTKTTILETKIIVISYYLKLLAQNLKKAGKLDKKGAVDFIFNQMQQIIIDYKNTKQININYELNGLINQIYSNKIKLSDLDSYKLNTTIQSYNEGRINESGVIEELNKYEILKEKKTKVR